MLIAGIVIAVTASSATFAYFEAERDVHIEVVPDDNELIDLVPLQPYAFIGEGGVLVIDLSEYNQEYPAGKGKGVSPDSIYVFEHMFGVSNHLWENITICMEITYQGTGGVTFFIGDYVPGVTLSSTAKTTGIGFTTKTPQAKNVITNMIGRTASLIVSFTSFSS